MLRLGVKKQKKTKQNKTAVFHPLRGLNKQDVEFPSFFKKIVFLVGSTLIVKDCNNNALIICIAVGLTLGHPRRTHRNPGGMVQFGHFFFPAGEGSC